MTFKEFLNSRTVILDGGTGTVLQAEGLPVGMPTEQWNIENPDAIVRLHRAYFDAGSNAVATNTFGVNGLKYTEAEIEKLVGLAVQNAKKAAALSSGKQEKFVLLDLGPTGRLLSPFGDLEFEAAVSAYVPVVRAGAAAGVDGFIIETVNDCFETKAILLAVKENSDLPVIVSNAYSLDKRLFCGSSPAVMVAMLEGMGADAIGVNCSFGPTGLLPVIEEYCALSSLPILLKPNAGMPKAVDGKTVYDVSAESFAQTMASAVKMGVRCVGGCCGTTPSYIEKTAEAIRDLSPIPVTKKNKTLISSSTVCVDFDEGPVLIGERINPTGKKRMRQALQEKEYSYLLEEAVGQQEKGVQVLDVNVGAPGISEAEVLPFAVSQIQNVCSLPLEIDSSDPVAMEKAMRRYVGKPLVNSVNGKKESMDAVFPLIRKYGGVAVALTLDEKGIPNTAEERLAIAERILGEAAKYGIDKKDIVFDPLALTVSTDQNAANVTLKAVDLIRARLGCHTLLGVSNVSFGLPNRNELNRTFLLSALSCGLSAAIMNPYAEEMMWAYHAYRALRGADPNCLTYIAFATERACAVPSLPEKTESLATAIVKGLKSTAGDLAERELRTKEGLSLIQTEIIPALDTVGRDFENHRVFLPQLLMSAEAASAAFDKIKAANSSKEQKKNGVKIVLATVKGDIHDIGKNIVRMLLCNYGFDVTDLGKDVDPRAVVDAAVQTGADIVGLSALMTTTLPAMENTVRLLRETVPTVKIVVGGAVLTEDFAEKIGADAYAADAMATVRFAESIKTTKAEGLSVT